MKQLISAIKYQPVQRSVQTLFRSLPIASFSNKKYPSVHDDPNAITPSQEKIIENEKALTDKLSEKERTYLYAERLLKQKEPDVLRTDQNLWWNKVQNMTEEELRTLPQSFLMKFGTFLEKIEANKISNNEEQNKTFIEYHLSKNLDHLYTNEELELVKEEKDKLRRGERHYEYEREGYMARQPRLDLSKYNYNFEQFREYTSLYEECKKKDEAELKNFYKMVKYSLLNAPKGDRKAITFAKRFRLDLIEIPEEYKDVNIDDVVFKTNRRHRRPVIKVRTNDISDYDAWRCHDRELVKTGGKMACKVKIMLPPALIVKAFGLPTETRTGFEGTGEYDFEDANLDTFNLADYKQTDHYWGLNREDEYYEKFITQAPHKRRRKWPSIKEFWESMEPKEFKLTCQEHADYRKFRTWIRKAVAKAENKKMAFDEYIAKRYTNEIDICPGDYDVKGKVNHDNIAVFKWDYTYYMTEEEIKKLAQKPEPLIPPQALDFSKAERVIITKEEIKLRELQEQEQLKNL